MNLLEQNGALTIAYELFKNMRCVSKFNKKVKDMLPFQKICLITTKAIKMLFHDLKRTYNDEFKFILTHRSNNDALGNLFSQIRTKARKLHHEFPYMGDFTYKLANQQLFSAPLTVLLMNFLLVA